MHTFKGRITMTEAGDDAVTRQADERNKGIILCSIY